MRKRLHSIRVDPPGPILLDEAAPGFAELVLRLADETSEAEDRIWREVERLARAGDAEGILRLVERIRAAAPVDVAAELDSDRPTAA